MMDKEYFRRILSFPVSIKITDLPERDVQIGFLQYTEDNGYTGPSETMVALDKADLKTLGEYLIDLAKEK